MDAKTDCDDREDVIDKASETVHYFRDQRLHDFFRESAVFGENSAECRQQRQQVSCESKKRMC